MEISKLKNLVENSAQPETILLDFIRTHKFSEDFRNKWCREGYEQILMIFYISHNLNEFFEDLLCTQISPNLQSNLDFYDRFLRTIHIIDLINEITPIITASNRIEFLEILDILIEILSIRSDNQTIRSFQVRIFQKIDSITDDNLSQKQKALQKFITEIISFLHELLN